MVGSSHAVGVRRAVAAARLKHPPRPRREGPTASTEPAGQQPPYGLGPSSIRKLIDTLGSILEEAVGREARRSSQREPELGADLDELRQLGCQLERVAVGHELGTAFEDGDAALVVEV